MYTVAYRGNGNTGGSAPIDSNKYYSGESAKVLGKGSLVKTNATFQGWARTSSATSATVSAGSSITINNNVTLYAVWKTNTPQAPPTKPTTPATPPRPPVIVVRPEPTPPAEPEITTTNEQTTTDNTPAPDFGQSQTNTGPVVIPPPVDLVKPDSTRIGIGNIPFGDFTSNDSWSLASMILSIIAAIVALSLILGYFIGRRRNDDIENNEYERRGARKERVFRIIGVITGLIIGPLWLILDDLNLRIAWINKWTPIIAALFLIHIVFCLVYQRVKSKEQRDDAVKEMNQQDIPTYM